ncbi:MAG: Rpn family recombination-promoting nuclease/putative transposase [Synergistaceae bacterium]|nr:Rpn family recombination-promoting nuclease/putative transposase [Synergistaceae bacterium]
MNIDEMNRSLPFELRWENLTLANDFMFGKVFQDEDLSLELVRMILPWLDIERITLHETQKSAHETVDTHGVRFDVYIHDDAGRIIILEMQVVKVKYLARRSRAYHSSADLDARESGRHSGYGDMPEVYVIFICEFDPFGLGRHVYTFRKICCEDKELELDDGQTTIFLSTKGRDGKIDDRLKAFLDFVEGRTSDDEFVKKLECRLKYAKHNWRWRREYVLDTLERNSLIQDAEERGIAIGEERGIIIGEERGIIIGEERGRLATVEDTVRLLREHGMNPEQIESIRLSLMTKRGDTQN